MMKVFLQKIGEDFTTIVLHALSWITIVLISMLFQENMPGNFSLKFQGITWGLYVLFFYLNYSVLIPRLLFNNRSAVYILTVIISIAMLTYVRFYLWEHVFHERFGPERFKDVPREVMENVFGERERPPFKHLISFISINGFLIAYFGSTSLRFLIKWNDEEKSNREREKQKITAELAYLKQQINPHFLFNSLNSIYSLANRNSDKTAETILKLSEVLRYMLYDADKRSVTLEKEINNIRGYLDLQRQKLNKKTTINFNVSGNNFNQSITPLLLLPLVENAIKYGADNVSKSEINIGLSLQGQELTLRTSNPILLQSDKNRDSESSGIGLKNVKRRLELCYPDNYKLDIVIIDNIYRLELVIQLSQT